MEWSTKQQVMRALRGLAQKELAGIVDIPNTYLSDFETGKSYPNPDWESRIKEALGWTEFTDLGLAILSAESFDPVVAQMLREVEAVILGKREAFSILEGETE